MYERKPPARLEVQKALAIHRKKNLLIFIVRLPRSITKNQEVQMDEQSLAHTKWNCKYHAVFAPKYRRQIIYGKIKREVGKILRDLCERKGVEIIEAECCPDHIHMLVSIPPKYSISSIMGYLKGKSSLMIFDRFGNLKYKYGNRQFWCRGIFR